MTAHVEELAELYALGALDDRSRAQVDRHASQCGACARRIGEAEATVAQLVQEARPSEQLDRRMHAAFAPNRSWRAPSALVAAAFVLGLLPTAWIWNAGRTQNAFNVQQQTAVHALATSHFAHAQFVPLVPNAPPAKMLFGRTRPWRYFVAQTRISYTVTARRGAAAVVLGRLTISGNAGELFVPNAPPADEYILSDGSRIVAHIVQHAR